MKGGVLDGEDEPAICGVGGLAPKKVLRAQGCVLYMKAILQE